jgi:hypothetical protein
MLDDLINKIKGLLGQSEEVDDFDLDDEKTRVISVNPKENDGENHDEVDDEVDEVAKKKTMIIRGLVVAVIAWVVIEDYTLEKNLPPAPAVGQKKQARNPKKKILQKKQAAIVKITPTVAPVATVATNPVVETTPSPDIEPKIEPTIEPIVEITPAPAPSETPVAEVKDALTDLTPDVAELEKMKPDDPEPKPPIEKVIVAGDDDSQNSMLSDLDQSTPSAKISGKDAAKGLSALGDALMKIKARPQPAKSIIANPPDYLIIGRGLVYNCLGKHWACVDKKSYFQCSRNFKARKIQKKKPLCSVVAVYTSDEDCQTIQTYNINTSVPTDFCK